MIFSDNKYTFWRVRCDTLSSKQKYIVDRENKSAFKFGHKTKKINIPTYVSQLLYFDGYKNCFKSKKDALEYCKKAIEDGFLEKRKPCGYSSNRRLIQNKTLRIEKWIRFKFQPNKDQLPSTKEEKVKDFLVRDDRDGIIQSVSDHNNKKDRK